MNDERRVGDTVAIPGQYQHEATHRGFAAQRFWHQKRFEACLELLAPGPGMRVLDVGCGSGVFADQVARTEGVSVMAVDANADAVRFATSTYGRPGLEVRRGHVDELDLADRSFDRISFLEVIEHVHEPQARAALADFARLLRPGGRLVISTPNARSAWPLIEWALDRSRLLPTMEGEQHVAAYTPESLRTLVEQAGFTLRESRTLFVAAPWLAGVSWRLAERVHAREQEPGTAFGALLVQAYERRP
jgi:2-polyprenyl-3-methyl-5-hydroxy-6-metoxy-1,4-benzoquinol methylase